MRRTVLFTFTIVLLVLSVPTVSADTFFDENQAGSEFSVYIENLSSQHIVNGSSGNFYPLKAVTRGELIKMLVGAAKLTANTIKPMRLTDVSAVDPFYTYIQIASEHNITQGYPDGTFRPNIPVSRAEAAKLIDTAFGVVPLTGTVFSDVPVSNSLAGYIAAAKNKGLLSGYPDDTFHPSEQLIRAHAAKIISNAMNVGDPLQSDLDSSQSSLDQLDSELGDLNLDF